MNIVKEMELAQEKEIEVSIPPHQKLQLEQELPRLSSVMVAFMAYV